MSRRRSAPGGNTSVSAPSSSASTTRERLAAGETLVGTFLNLGSALAAEVCARAGFDWLLFDLEQGAGTERELIPTLQAIERPRFARALDAGADGVMVPRVDSAAEAAQAVACMRTPPRGVRGVAYMNRAADWGRARDGVDALCVIQIESGAAVDDAEAIAAVDGVDVLFVGPNDLSAALGTDDLPLAKVLEAADARGKTAGILARSREDADRYVEDGFRFVGIGSDSLFLVRGARAAAGTA